MCHWCRDEFKFLIIVALFVYQKKKKSGDTGKKKSQENTEQTI